MASGASGTSGCSRTSPARARTSSARATGSSSRSRPSPPGSRRRWRAEPRGSRRRAHPDRPRRSPPPPPAGAAVAVWHPWAPMTASSAPEPAAAVPAAPPRHSHAGTPAVLASGSVFVALFVLALSLRPQLSAIGPLVPEILVEFGPSHAFIGLLTAIPVFCLGLFALVGPIVAGRFGTRGGVALSVAVLVGCAVLRAFAPGAELVLLATFGIGVGTGVVGPILAMFVRDRMPSQNVGGTSAYAGGTLIGAALGAALAVPLAAAFGGWRGSLLVISVVSVLSIVAWLLLVRRRPPRPGEHGDPARSRRIHLPQLPV